MRAQEIPQELLRACLYLQNKYTEPYPGQLHLLRYTDPNVGEAVCLMLTLTK